MGHDGLEKQYDIVILGAGGHASVIIDILKSQTEYKICVLDQEKNNWGRTLLDCPIIGGDELLNQVKAEYFIIGVGSVHAQNNILREKLFQKALSSKLKPYALISKNSYVSPFTKIGEGTVIFPKAVIQTNASIGCNSIINSGAIIEHDSIVSDHVHVCPGSVICGDVYIGTYSMIGAGATVRQSIEIGQSVTVGAASVVLKDIADNKVVVGHSKDLV